MGSTTRSLGHTWLLLSVLAGCEGAGSFTAGGAGDAERGDSRVGGHVVSTVDGHPITVERVRSLVQRSGMAAREALERLQQEQLLMEEAERRGFGRHPRVVEVGERALVQALLNRVAADAEVTDREIEEAYEADEQRFREPERRESLHVLVRLEADASAERETEARRLAESIRLRLDQASDPRQVMRALGGEKREGFDLVAEPIGPVSRDSTLAEPFLEALFTAGAPGVLPSVTRTPFGWHAIVLLDVQPAVTTPLSEARDVLQEELLVQKRKQRLEALLDELRGRYGAAYDPAAMDRITSLELFR